MEERLNVLMNKKPAYDIVYRENFDGLKDELTAFAPENRKFCIITDSNVGPLYAKQIEKVLEGVCARVDVYTFEAGEQNKNLDTVKDIYRFLIENHYDRKDFLIALGGGVVGDTCGYAAATYLRGISFIQIPTTLLAMVDSSIGGKTGVDFEQYKNMVGAFHMPKLVYMNLTTLKDLDDRQYFAGFAEVMKSALIRDGIYYEWLIENLYEICDHELPVIQEMVYRCNLIKKSVVEKDPTEQGERALLNLGHTIGHAIEKYKNFSMLHGECVALGCVAAAYISWKKEFLSMEEYYEIRDMFVPFNLPISIDDIEPEAIVALTKSDKKMENGHIKFILLKKIGKAFISTDVSDEEMLNAVKEIYFSEEDERE